MQAILLIEDDPKVSSFYLRALQELNATILVSSSISEAKLLLATDQNISVVITDYRLADGDGLSLIQNIRETGIQREWLQFILITGHANVSLAQRAIELGVSQLLTKPIRREVLANVATSALLASYTAEKETKADEIIARTFAEVELKLGAISRYGRLRGKTNRKMVDYQKRLLVELERQLDRRNRISKAQLSDNEWVLLLQVAVAEFDENPITLKSAAYRLGIPLSSLIRQANSLCERGLLERWDDPSDARRSFLRVTRRAQAIVQKITDCSLEQLDREVPCTD